MMNKQEEDKLNKRGIRPTATRILVLQYLTKLGHMTSLLDLENYFDYAEKSTLYRTLKTFENNGIIHKIEDGTGVVKYGLCSETCECAEADQHFHFHCEKCKETFCLTSIKIPILEVPKNFVINQSNLVLKGICSNCN